MQPYQIILVDDHSMFRKGLKNIIEQSQDFQVTFDVEDRSDLIRIIKNSPPDLVIMDISITGFEIIQEIKRHSPRTKALILTMHRNREFIYHAYHNHADGYMLKDDSDVDLFSAIHVIRSGGFYLSPILTKELTSNFIDICLKGNGPPEELLTAREIEIIKFVAEGKSAKEIAELLFISPRTVEHHRAKIMKKLNLRKSTEMVKFAIKKGYCKYN